jgi:hypothetical protein
MKEQGFQCKRSQNITWSYFIQEQGLKYKKASQELIRNYFAVYKSLEKVLWKRHSWGRVAHGGEGLIPGSSGKERLIGKKRSI